MRICLDIDGTLCEVRGHGDDYAAVRPLPQAAERIRALRAAGHYVILATARHMQTCNSNVGMVVARQGQTLIAWLDRHGIEYDELWFGKPHADVYVDDKAFTFSGNWNDVTQDTLHHCCERVGKINIVVAMAGAGARFAQKGYHLPKPLIPAFGEPMYRHAVRSLPLHLAERLIFLIRDGRESDRLRQDIEDTFAPFRPIIVAIDHLTRGQAETVLYARHQLAFHRPVLIHNADSAFEMSSFADFPPAADGALLLFRGSGKKWSYAAMDNHGRISQVREKDEISPFASTGTYYFRSTVQLMDLIQQALQRDETVNGEFYIGPLYNTMAAQGQQITGLIVDRFISFGTPEDLTSSEALASNADSVKRLADRIAKYSADTSFHH
jgi:UDP-N-acetylglucosamine diphosphorylase / glucose-1-phosphate thymidylyltransferase / UDP-N-acetylgalactosamine diphosphorylase / glucosamine-1-phosphate N-acetyltransferase / galactosamine-1-phosphate N-acetyltransferase